MKKIRKILTTLLVITLTLITSIEMVSAVSNTIEFGPSGKTGKYINNTHYSILNLKNKETQVYCLEALRPTTENITANLVKNSGRMSGGLTYILMNGYPQKSITGNNDQDFYITQTAVWWYLDKTTGSTNLGEGIKSTGPDPYGLRPHITKLVNDAYAHRNDSYAAVTPNVKLEIANKNMTITEGYYVSKAIKMTSTTSSSATITLENAPTGTIIIKDNNEYLYSKGFSVKPNETFQVKVPFNNNNTSSKDLKIKATASSSGYQVYEYQPTNTAMQSVVLLDKTEKSSSTELTLTMEYTAVSVIKIDANTKQSLAGATLVLKDANGNQVSSWETTINEHVIKNLPNGTYSIEEVSAPKGYILNKQPYKFTITDTNKNIKITIPNTPKSVVVNITKIDKETNAPLAGAVLVVRKSDGTEVVRFTTTAEAYVLTNLEDGTYSVEELSAPAGYIKSNEVISFTVDENHLSHQITFANNKEVIVPDTDSVASIIMFILGISIIAAGIEYVYKNGQKAYQK